MLPGIKEARGTYSFNILAELSKFNNVDTLFNISNELYTILKVSDKI